jgi:threonine dehydrogenase-like Zn-dependent dehydrogenase
MTTAGGLREAHCASRHNELADVDMKAGQITAPGRIDLVDVEEPGRPSHGEVVVALETACVCGSDVALFSERQPAYPLPPGLSLHEMVGRIVASDSRGFAMGDRVLAMPPALRGCFERLRLADTRLVKIDDAIRNDEAVLSQPLATVLSALSALPNVIGAEVAVVGQGPIGLLFNACLSNLGAARIIGVDALEARVAGSREFGATDAVRAHGDDAVAQVAAATNGATPDLVVEAVGHEQQAFNLCAALCREGGRLLYFGVPPARIDGVAWESAFRKNLTIHTSTPTDLRPFVNIALQWIRRRRVDVERLITHRYRLADIQRAFETYRDRRDGALKVMIDFDDRTR